MVAVSVSGRSVWSAPAPAIPARALARRPASRLVRALAIVAGVAAVGGAMASDDAGRAVGPAASRTAFDPPTSARPTQAGDADGGIGDCRSELRAIRRIYAAIPTDFRVLGRDRIAEAAQIVESCRQKLIEFRQECADVVACDVPLMLARLNTSLSARQRVAWERKDKLPPDEVGRRVEKLRDEIIELGIENAAIGMDPDARRKPIFGAFNAMVGSATLMLFDRTGRLMWWMQDPREMDSALVIGIWDRLARG